MKILPIKQVIILIFRNTFLWCDLYQQKTINCIKNQFSLSIIPKNSTSRVFLCSLTIDKLLIQIYDLTDHELLDSQQHPPHASRYSCLKIFKSANHVPSLVSHRTANESECVRCTLSPRRRPAMHHRQSIKTTATR